MANQRTINLLGAVICGFHRHLSHHLEQESGISGDGPAALIVIYNNEGRSVEFLRRALLLSHSWTVRLVEKLEQAGLVHKRTGIDKRTVDLLLTDQGRRKANAILKARRRCLDEALSTMLVSDQKKLTPMLESLLSFLSQDEESVESICKLCELAACPHEICPVVRPSFKPAKNMGLT